MRANEFVKKFGWDSAKKVLEVAPIRATSYRTSENNHTGLGGLFGRIDNEYGNIVLLSDLKRLVESWELVESYGGLHGAKEYTEKLISASSRQFGGVFVNTLDKADKIKQAIKDVESCQ